MRYLRMVLYAVLFTLPIAALARAPYRPPHSDAAILRFSWRMNIAARENCRPRTEQELEALPVHMRTPEVCTRDGAHYTLVVRIDELPADTIHLVRGGVKGDRPLFVLEQRTLPPGQHHIRAQLLRSTADTILLATLDSTITMQNGMVQLITLDPDARRLVARSPKPRH